MTGNLHGYTRITIGLIAANFIVFILQLSIDGFSELVALTPSLAVNGYYWQFFTYMFAHGSISHIGLNMLGLFIFGGVMERVLGEKKYITLYILSGFGSSFLHMALTGISNVPMLGASGAVFGILTAYAYRFPKNTVWVFPGIPVPAAILVVFFVFFEFFSGIFGLQPGIANFGHLGGILVSLALMFFWQKRSKGGSSENSVEFIWESW